MFPLLYSKLQVGKGCIKGGVFFSSCAARHIFNLFPWYSCYEKPQPELGRHLSIEKAHMQLLQQGLKQRQFTFHYPEALKRLCHSYYSLPLSNIKLLGTGTHPFPMKTWEVCKLYMKTLEVDHTSLVGVRRDLWGSDLVKLPESSKVTQRWLLRAMSRRLLSISEDGYLCT